MSSFHLQFIFRYLFISSILLFSTDAFTSGQKPILLSEPLDRTLSAEPTQFIKSGKFLFFMSNKKIGRLDLTTRAIKNFEFSKLRQQKFKTVNQRLISYEKPNGFSRNYDLYSYDLNFESPKKLLNGEGGLAESILVHDKLFFTERDPFKLRLIVTNGTASGTKVLDQCSGDDCSQMYRDLYAIGDHFVSQKSPTSMVTFDKSLNKTSITIPEATAGIRYLNNGVLIESNDEYFFMDVQSGKYWTVNSKPIVEKYRSYDNAIGVDNKIIISNLNRFEIIPNYGKGEIQSLDLSLENKYDFKPNDIFKHNNELYFFVTLDHKYNSQELSSLYKINLNNQVEEIITFEGKTARYIASKGKRIFFHVDDTLMFTDGEAGNAFKLADGFFGIKREGSLANYFLDQSGLYYTGHSETEGTELWHTDGDISNTKIVMEQGIQSLNSLFSASSKVASQVVVGSFSYLENGNTKYNYKIIDIGSLDTLSISSHETKDYSSIFKTVLNKNGLFYEKSDGVFFENNENDDIDAFERFASSGIEIDQVKFSSEYVFIVDKANAPIDSCRLYASKGQKDSAVEVDLSPIFAANKETFCFSHLFKEADDGLYYFHKKNVFLIPDANLVPKLIASFPSSYDGILDVENIVPFNGGYLIGAYHMDSYEDQYGNSVNTGKWWFAKSGTLTDLAVSDFPPNYNFKLLSNPVLRNNTTGIYFTVGNELYFTDGTVKNSYLIKNGMHNDNGPNQFYSPVVRPNNESFVYIHRDKDVYSIIEQSLQSGMTKSLVSLESDSFVSIATVGNESVYVSSDYVIYEVNKKFPGNIRTLSQSRIRGALVRSGRHIDGKTFFGGDFLCGPIHYKSISIVTDVSDDTNPDIDGDGVVNSDDAFPLHSQGSVDTDGDCIPNSLDIDDDNDMVNDYQDQFPLDSAEWVDTDSDGLGDYADLDDDNDGILDWDDIDAKGVSGQTNKDGKKKIKLSEGSGSLNINYILLGLLLFCLKKRVWKRHLV